jgi:integrase
MHLRTKAKRQKDLQRKLNYDQVKSLEEKLAQEYCRKNSIQTQSASTLKESVFIGTPGQLTGAVLAELGALRGGEIPDYPQGLVIHDSKGQGAFD